MTVTVAMAMTEIKSACLSWQSFVNFDHYCSCICLRVRLCTRWMHMCERATLWTRERPIQRAGHEPNRLRTECAVVPVPSQHGGM